MSKGEQGEQDEADEHDLDNRLHDVFLQGFSCVRSGARYALVMFAWLCVFKSDFDDPTGTNGSESRTSKPPARGSVRFPRGLPLGAQGGRSSEPLKQVLKRALGCLWSRTLF